MYHYLTGAASWMMLTVITQMFGVRGNCGDMILAPQIMKEQFQDGRAGLTLNFGGRRWHIVYVNAQNAEAGTYRIGSVTLDGGQLAVQDNEVRIPLTEIEKLSEESTHEIIVELQA